MSRKGQYKSTLVCPACSKISVTFDPFMYLSLPLPSTIMRTMTITVLSGDGRALPMPFTVTVPKDGSCKDLIEALRIACCLDVSEALLIAEVYESRIYHYFDHCLPLSNIKDDDRIVAYRLPNNHADFLRLEIMHRPENWKVVTSKGFREPISRQVTFVEVLDQLMPCFDQEIGKLDQLKHVFLQRSLSIARRITSVSSISPPLKFTRSPLEAYSPQIILWPGLC